MILPYTRETNKNKREVFTFEINSPEDIKLKSYEYFKRVNEKDPTWYRQKDIPLRSVVVPEHIYRVIRAKMKEA